MNMKNDFFETSDFGCAVTLCALGFTLDCIDKTTPSRAVFVLQREDGLDETVQRYWSHNLAIDPLILFATQKEIKSRLYQ